MSKLTRRSTRVTHVSDKPESVKVETKNAGEAISRRAFLRNSSLMAGGAALTSTVAPVMMKKAQAASTSGGNITEVKTICTHCSVGCGIVAEVQNGVWTGQEPDFDSPINLGAHCAKGAA
ncbi:MAG: twin-arginine translocation signal domain-containing protein, partial [Gammaproteobacteria bacterium]|nr:twin-arginine translocation signal domain-containing protein [Gammaproteobacteria bacterium]